MDLASDMLGPDVTVAMQALPVDDLLGDGAPGWILDLHVNDWNAAFLAVVGTERAYHVFALRSYWLHFFQDEYAITVRDLNANGRPEVVIQDNYRGTGFTSACDKTLTVLEWEDDGFSNLTPGVTTSAQTDYGECLPIEVLSGGDGPATLTTGYTFYAGCDLNGEWVSREPRLVRRFAWNGTHFALADESFLPPAELDTDDVPIDACTLQWVNEIGPENAVARDALARALDVEDPAIVTAYTDQYGPAYHDFFAFKLGVALAMTGEDVRARVVLAAVRDTPRSSEFTAASRLAGAFLGAYEAYGAVAGCRAVAGLLDPAAHAILDDGVVFSPYDVDAMVADWGFADGAWGLRGRPLYDSPWLQTDALNLCSPAAALRQTLNGSDIFTTPALTRYLEAHAIPYAAVQEVDVDADGRSDWVLLIGTGRDDTLDVWTLLNRVSGIDAQWVTDTPSKPGIIPSTVAHFTPDPTEAPLTVYQWTGGVVALHVVRLNTGVRVVDRLNEVPTLGRGNSQEGLVIAAGDPSGVASTLTVRQAPTRTWTPAWFTVGWDDHARALIEVERIGDRYRAQLHEAERLLFDAHDPVAASTVLQSLAERWAELPDKIDPSLYREPAFRPYLTYLRGLAAEEAGDMDGAVRAYWSLWQTYPLHPLSAIAQRKLALVDPP